MAEHTRTPDTVSAGDNRADARENVEDNVAQRQSDAPADVVAEGDVVEASDRADGRGSDANGIPASDDADGERRKKLYEQGATLVSRID